MKEITLRSLRQPAGKDIEKDIEWFCESIGLLGERDKGKTCMRIFRSIMKSGEGMGIDDLAREIDMSRTAVIHHVRAMMDSGLVVRESGAFELRTMSLQKIVDEIELDVERLLRSVREIAEDIDREFRLPVRSRQAGSGGSR